MDDSSLYKKASECYVQATLDILNHYKSIVMEVHHIGSTSLDSVNLPGDIDILVLVKNSEFLDDLPSYMVDEGYWIVEDVSPYYKGETVLHCAYDDFNVNFILMDHSSKRKEDILYCRDCINKSPHYALQLKKIKDAYLKSRIGFREYQAKKSKLFLTIIDRPGDVEVV